MHDFRHLLALVPYFQQHPGRTTAEAAADLATTEAQILKDLKLLWLCGLPGQGGGDVIEVSIVPTLDSADDDDDDKDPFRKGGAVYLSNADYLSRPLRLTEDEALALILALDFAESIASSQLAHELASAREKLQDALGDRALRAGAVIAAGGSPEVRDQVAMAIAQSRQLQLVFDGQQRTTTPIVEPASTFVRDGYHYLHAYSLDRDDWRHYRMDRIATATVLEQNSSKREVPAIEPLSWAQTLTTTTEVTLTITPAARWISEYFPVLDATPDTVRLGVTSPDWLAALLLRLGPAVVALEPTQAATPAQQQAEAALARYASLSHANPA
ncbi:MAG: helix-turn-helix transcriptional regulator [Propionibacteriaceae bacterium]